MFDFREIDNIINSFLEKFDCFAQIGTDFCCNVCTNNIYYSLVASERQVNYFMEFYYSVAGRGYEIDPFVASLLHEVGHIETIDDVEDNEYKYSLDRKKVLSADSKEECFEYFNLPDERLATEWAANYVRNNYKEVSEFWNKLLPAIKNFYAVNNIH